MREIKFRAWEVSILPDGTIRKTMYYTNDLICWGEVPCPMIDTGFVDVELEKGELWVWMQFIGLKDMKERELYHKDCVKDDFKNIWLIDWSDEYAGFELTLLRSEIGEFPKLNICRVVDMEYIGNKYENPELLGS